MKRDNAARRRHLHHQTAAMKEALQPTRLDRAINYFFPAAGARRWKAKAFMALAGGYLGGGSRKRTFQGWNPGGNDADTDILPDLAELREYSRDAARKIPIATGALKTKGTNVVGPGFRLKSQLDREFLQIPDDIADAWESNTEREFRLFWNSKDLDAARTLTGDAITRQVYDQKNLNGDVFVLLPHIIRPGSPYSLRLQVIEADRVTNADNAIDTDTLAGGIRRDANGAPVEVHILRHHPGNNRHFKNAKWDKRPFFGGKTGIRKVIHLYQQDRPGQTRGVPDLAPVLSVLKQLGRYTDAELMAAVISGYFTVFIETESGASTLNLDDFNTETGANNVDTDKDYKMGPGAIVEMVKGDKISDANPGRPNSQFDPFVLSILRQIGVALELPFELLIKHFTASYSAAKAALVEGWKYFVSERHWLAQNFLDLVFEVWMVEAVATGRIPAPGFFSDPAIKAAYLGAQWIGPAKGQLDEGREVKAAALRVKEGITTLEWETAQMTGGSWEKNHPQSAREHKARKDAGLIEEKTAPAAPAAPEPKPDEDDD